MGWNKPEPPPVVQPLNLQPERTATNKSVVPVPVFWGRHRSGGTYLDNLWDQRTEEITDDVQTGKDSSEEVVTAVNYFGSFCLCIGYAHANKIISVIKDDEVVATPNFTFGTENSRLFEVGENVRTRIFRGTAGRDLTFPGNPNNHPAYLNLLSIRFLNLLVGSDPTPPNYELIFESVYDPLDLSVHQSGDGGQFIPEILFSALTHPLFGGQVSPDRFDLPSWEAAAERLIDEDLGYSAMLREKTSIDSWTKTLLNFCGGEVTDIDGKLRFTLIRDDTTTIQVPETAFLKDAVATPGSWESNEIVNEARVNYAPLESNLEPIEIIDTDDASQNIVGIRSKTYDFNGIRSQRVAAIIAARAVKMQGFPSVRYEFDFESSQDFLNKGDIITPTFSPQNIGGRKMKVTDITKGEPGKSSVRVQAVIDKSYIFNLQASDEDAEVERIIEDPEEISGHVTFLPPAQLEGFNDGFIMALSRQTPADDQAFVSFSNDDIAYETIISARSFPLRINILRWRDFGNGNFTIDFSFSQEHEEQSFLNSITNGAPDWHMLSSLFRNGSQVLETAWSSMRRTIDIVPLGGGEFSVSLESGQFGTQQFDAGTYSPSSVAYISSVNSFIFKRSNQLAFSRDEGNAPGDNEMIRYFTVQSSRRNNLQDDEDVFRLNFDRLNGTFNPSWGEAVDHDFSFGINSSNTNGIAPLTTLIELTGTENADYSIDWGDGTPVLDAKNQGMTSTETHEYLLAGSYIAVITIAPTSGGAATVFNVEVTVA